MDYTSCYSHRRSSDVFFDIDYFELEEQVGLEDPFDGFSKIARAKVTPSYRSAEFVKIAISERPRARPVSTSIVDISWLSELYLSGENTRVSSKTLANAIVNINNLLKSQKFDSFSIVLNALQLDRVAPEVMIAFARLTFPVRLKIPGWAKFVSRVDDALKSRGIDGKLVLQGLR